MVYEWIYDLPNLPNALAPRKSNVEIFDKQLYTTWLDEWLGLLLSKLENEEDDPTIQILVRMIEIEVTSRWSATKCLMQGLKSGLFKRRVDRARKRSERL